MNLLYDLDELMWLPQYFRDNLLNWIKEKIGELYELIKSDISYQQSKSIQGTGISSSVPDSTSSASSVVSGAVTAAPGNTRFVINCGRLTGQAQLMDTLKASLEEYARTLSQMQFSRSLHVEESVRILSERVMQNANGIDSLMLGLQRIISDYQSTEQAVVGNIS